jgi:CDP-diacylglycerol--glycerol-3-phosphate 3-phosphatidyltransferase
MKNIPNLITITRILGTTVLVFIFVLNIKFPLLGIYWVIIIAVIRFTSLGVGFMRYKQLTFLHTYANKLTGISLFISIFMYVGLGLYTTTILVCFIASISALEELIINTVSKKLCRDIKSIFLL